MRYALAVAAVWLGAAAPLRAQTPPPPAATSPGPLGLPNARWGSGTSWLPDSSPMRAVHFMAGKWALMLHGQAFLQYDRQGGPRGASQLGSVNWIMAAASRQFGPGTLQLRGMFSAEPWTVGGRGYPLLLQSGESYHGVALHDRQHPHDLWVELAALYLVPVARNLGVLLYAAPVGEPAVGPVSFPHRPSAADDPLAPISHHWQDATHITFGVFTAGVFTRTLKLEASWFNGREPDENRTNFDYAGRRLDSWSTRLTVNPDPRWSLAAWYAYLKSPDALNPAVSLDRFGAAALTTQPIGHGTWSSALIYGANVPAQAGGRVSNSILAETTLDLDRVNAVFGRAEFVQKDAADLVIPGVAAATVYGVGEVTLGYVRTIERAEGLTLGLGLSGSVNFVPASLAPLYGARSPLGAAIYLRVRPETMRARSGAMPGM